MCDRTCRMREACYSLFRDNSQALPNSRQMVWSQQQAMRTLHARLPCQISMWLTSHHLSCGN
ncbi:MAG: hypothetical protein ACOVP8_05890, partial [Phycisphaerales bacterium]